MFYVARKYEIKIVKMINNNIFHYRSKTSCSVNIQIAEERLLWDEIKKDWGKNYDTGL